MTEEKYTQFVNSLTSTTLEGFTTKDVNGCLGIMRRANTMEHAIIRAVMTLQAAENVCGNCNGCTKKDDIFCPKRLKQALSDSINTDSERISDLKSALNSKYKELDTCAKQEKPECGSCELCVKKHRCKIIAEIEEIKGKIKEIEK